MGYLHGIETLEVLNGARPVSVVRSSVIGLIGTAPDADTDAYPINTPVLHIGGAEALGKLGDKGTLLDALRGIFAQGVGVTAVIVRVEAGEDDGDAMGNIAGDAAAMTGVHGFLKAQAMFGVTPRILIAPGFTSQRPSGAANPVVTALLGIAQRRRGIVIADGPSTTKEAALTYAQDWGSDRVYIVDPAVTVFEGGQTVQRPASAYVAGLIARVDRDFGYHHSPSNHEIFGITGTARPVGFFMGDQDTEANALNEKRIATIIRENGFRLWGNETPSTEPLNKFLSVRRTHDVIADSIQQAHLWALDKPFSLQLLLDVAETVNGFLRILKSRGVTLGGKVWIDPAKNTKEAWVDGHLTVDYDAEAPAPMQRITFKFNRNTGYYDELATSAAAEIAQLTA
ncbi:MAG: phage tail sheath subtilisin-like domain-containing protein [Paracoccus sp. (in: a-proteobacteria)]|uniref:phage tail sheath subtilisin-like domain-containing protein n=1 Tax=Paracoccus sp. TaxID=267 RepID=UPI0026DFB5DE|nr:phage tail sheath subtilisin-like domain-containing protein [Paracoccus sp. (in: a-proteobacteria)]MDO5631144.1 phage tail sheath subtilisin-like domain-containing protein [Paracoccus sp. (in: a-proteobacteria)]